MRAVLRYAGQTQPPPSPTYVPPNLATGALLSYSQLAAYFPVTPITATPTHTFPAVLGMGPGPNGMVFTINGEAWPNVTPFQVAAGDDVQVDMSSAGMGGMGMNMYHPMHVHGHFFRLMGTAGGTLHPPLKDTVLIRPSGLAGSSVSVQMEMNNPGRWVYHCHNVDHLIRGMMTIFDYTTDVDADGLPDFADMEPTTAVPVVTIDDMAAAFAPGGSGAVHAQWTPGQGFVLFVGLRELATPLVVPPYGTYVLDPFAAALYGGATTSALGQVDFPYAIPNIPGLVGLRLGLQGIGATTMSGGMRLSTHQAMTVR